MRRRFSLFGVAVAAAVLVSGCANTEQKLGRGVNNTWEIVRLGEMHRSVEQTALFNQPDVAYTGGFVTGMGRSLARTGIGVYEIVTCPLPPYGPVFTDYLTPDPVFPDSYAPTLMEDSTFATDTKIGFSGGDIAPIFPGSRFSIFDAH